MPYINQLDRAQAKDHPATSGELNFCITTKAIQCISGEVTASTFSVEVMKVIENYLETVGPRSYENFNDVMGVLDCIPRELDRRLTTKYQTGRWLVVEELKAMAMLFYALTMAPYEDGKIAANGDVFPEGWV